MKEIPHKVIRNDDNYDCDDFKYALEENPQEFGLGDVMGILAEIPGENDELYWYWILKLNDGRYVYADGWCDYTGWDCQSGLECQFAKTALKAASLAPEREEYSKRYIREQLIAQLKGKQPYAMYIAESSQ